MVYDLGCKDIESGQVEFVVKTQFLQVVFTVSSLVGNPVFYTFSLYVCHSCVCYQRQKSLTE